jgi:hypothetical protein
MVSYGKMAMNDKVPTSKKKTAEKFNVLKCSPFAGGRQENVKI